MERIIEDRAKTILSSVEWSAGEEQGTYVDADAFGEWNKEGWEEYLAADWFHRRRGAAHPRNAADDRGTHGTRQ